MVELFVTFFKLGLFTFGGGIAMISVLRDIVVNEKGWFSDEEMIDIIAICQSMPGVIAVNMATYVGYKRRGLLGSLVATTGVILPSFIIILILANGIASIGDYAWLSGMLVGMKAAATGLIIVTAWNLAKETLVDAFSLILGLLSFVAIAFFDINVVYVIIVALVLGIARAFMFNKSVVEAAAELGNESSEASGFDDACDLIVDAADDSTSVSGTVAGVAEKESGGDEI